jgi:signal transduction histidine kinase
MKVEGPAQELSPETRLLIFRIVQEALQNVVKHAKATKVHIDLHYTAGQLEVSVSDDGMGFSPSVLQNNATLGMTSMNQRAAMLNGELQITSARNKGATITLKLPIN